MTRPTHNIGGGRGGALFCRWYFFYIRTHGIPNQKCCCCCCCCKVVDRCRHAANIAFDLFNIFLYVIARKVRKCPLSPFVTSNVVLSCLVQKADSLSALQLTGALFTINWDTLCQTNLPPPPIHPFPQPPPHPTPPPPPPTFWTAPPPLQKYTIYARFVQRR